MGADESTRELSSFHEAFGNDLRRLFDRMPVFTGMRVLDAACGDGFYVSALESRVGPNGVVVGLDASVSILRDLGRPSTHNYVAGRLDRAPLRTGRFDAVLCCQSLFSLPEPVQSIAQLAKLVRPEGLVIVIENDSLHQLMLPWPPELEIALRSAEYDHFRNRSAHPRKFYVGRHLPYCFAEAGLEPAGFFTKTFDRVAPLDPAVSEFLQLHLRGLEKRIAGRLSSQDERSLRDLLGDDDGLTWTREPTFTVTWQSVLAWAKRP
jgi:ubiquinone/menaquinone biosynthesis C-methylase UbiE